MHLFISLFLYIANKRESDTYLDTWGLLLPKLDVVVVFLRAVLPADVLLHLWVEREEVDRVNLLLILCIILQNVNKNTKTHGTD
jgi:hypothetical protein